MRIDDYNTKNHNIIIKIIEKTINLIPNLKIFVGIIISKSDFKLLNILLEKFSNNIIFAFHGYIHDEGEFLDDVKLQEISFLKVDLFFQQLNYKNRYFIPPFNKFNNETINLLKKYKYNNFLINYKDFQKNDEILKSNFKILESNYFFNKRNLNGVRYIDDIFKIKDEIKYLKNKNINIGIEVHPQYIKTKEDLSKYIYLINYLKNEK